MKLGVAGLGRMGGPIARRLVNAGQDVTVFDVNAAAADELVSAGAQQAASPRELADMVDIVLVSLPNPEVVKAVALGPDGVAAGRRARLFVDLSTTGPGAAVEVAKGLAEAGKTAIDSPVSGGVAGARRGTLSLMVSCPAVAFEELRPVLEMLGHPTHVSETPGAAQVLKLANNLLAVSALAITSEACVFGVKSGLDPAVMCDVFGRSSGINTATLDKFPKSVLPGTFDFGFATGLALKDVRLCLEEAARLGVPTPVGDAVRDALAKANDMFGPDSDFTSIVRPLEAEVGVEVRSKAPAKP